MSWAVFKNADVLEDNCKELDYCEEDNTVALRTLERARDVISGDIERKRRTLKLESSARGEGGHSIKEQPWEKTSEQGIDEEGSSFWGPDTGSLFQPAEEPSPAPSPDVMVRANLDDLRLEFGSKLLSREEQHHPRTIHTLQP